ncbi:MAG: hypothetical protein WBA98_06850 [Gordonia sp. (in: high G+C Gram-positive bacteria)]|uniref:TPR repeat region-containing protein n=1 Tax=Gordonia sp. (in: high G+C Gram-positive bacteria) TaxID=84139 RepID=UPI003C7272A5
MTSPDTTPKKVVPPPTVVAPGADATPTPADQLPQSTQPDPKTTVDSNPTTTQEPEKAPTGHFGSGDILLIVKKKEPASETIPEDDLKTGNIPANVDTQAIVTEDLNVLNGQSPDGKGVATPEQIDAVNRRVNRYADLPDKTLNLADAGLDANVDRTQYDYATLLLQGLAGKSGNGVDNTRKILDKNPNLKLPISKMMQWTTDENIVSTVTPNVGKEAQRRGGAHNLPRDFQASLDNLTIDVEPQGGKPETALRKDNYDRNVWIADLAAMSTRGSLENPRRYMTGTRLNDLVLDAGRRYLDLQRDAQAGSWRSPGFAVEIDKSSDFRKQPPFMPEQRVAAPNGKMMNIFYPDHMKTTLAEPFIDAVALDKSAVRKAFENKETGVDFVKDLNTHNWNDDGLAIGKLYSFDDADFDVDNSKNPLDVARADRAARIMSITANIATSDQGFPLFTNLVGVNGPPTLGKANPYLARALSKSFAPYIDDMMDAPPPRGNRHRGWTAFVNDDKRTVRLFDILNTDKEAGERMQSAVMQKQQEWNQYYGNDMAAGKPGSLWLQKSGHLAGLFDNGMNAAIDREFNDATKAAAEVAQRKTNAATNFVEALSFGVDFIPGSKLVTKIGTTAFNTLKTTGSMKMAGEDKSILEKMLISGPVEANRRTADKAKMASDVMQYQILSASGDLRKKLKGQDLATYAPYLDKQTGKILPYDRLVAKVAQQEKVSAKNAGDLTSSVIVNMTGKSGIEFHDIHLYSERYDDALAIGE